MEGRSVCFTAGTRCHHLNGSKEMPLNEQPLREILSEVNALRGHSEQLEMVLPFGRFRKPVLYITPRKLLATWLRHSSSSYIPGTPNQEWVKHFAH